MCLWLNNPPAPSCEPTNDAAGDAPCGRCGCVPRFWLLDAGAISGVYAPMSGQFVLSRAYTPIYLVGSTSTVITIGSGNFTVPAGVTSLTIELWGGGGGGLPNGSGPDCGGGGAYCKLANQAVTPGQLIAYTVGAAGSISSDGGSTITTFGLMAGGGQDAADGGAGGTASGGTTNLSGGNGGLVSTGGASPNGGAGGTASSPNGGAPGGGAYADQTGTKGTPGAGQITFTSQTQVTVLDPSSVCAWTTTVNPNGSLPPPSYGLWHWLLYYGAPPFTVGTGPSDWWVSADVRDPLHTPNDVFGYQRLGAWECLGPNLLTQQEGALTGGPNTVTVQPFWP